MDLVVDLKAQAATIERLRAVRPIDQFAREHLYAVLRGEADYDLPMIKVAMDLVDFELPKNAVVANIHSPDNLKERCLRQLSVVRCLKKARRAGGPDDVAKVINGGGEEPSPDHAPHGHVC